MKKLIPLLVLSVFLSGCGKIELNNASIPLALGLDLQNNEIVIVAQIASLSSPEKAKEDTPQFKLLTARGRSVSEAARNTNLYASPIPLWSHTQIAVLGGNLCRQNVTYAVDFLARNRFVRKNDLIVVAHKASPEQILSVKPYLEPYTAIAIRNILINQDRQLGIYAPINAHEFLQQLSAPGVEPVVPMVSLHKDGTGEQVLLDGMAVFKKDRMIGQLNEMESRGYFLMRPEVYYGGLFPVHWDKGEEQWLTMEITRSSATVTPQIQQRQIKMKIQVIAEGNFYEQGGRGNLFTGDIFRQIEEACEQELARQLAMSIHKAQSLNSDIFGWGQTISRHEPEVWKTAGPEWEQLFPAIPYELDIRFYLRRSYETDKSFVYR